MGIFDMHWHGRDWEEASKETIHHSLQIADAAGLVGIVAKPNTKPPLTTRELCEKYLALAKDAGVSVEFYVNIALTANPDQIKRAFDAMCKNKRIVAPKVYLGPSTNPEISVVREDDELVMWSTLAAQGYAGVVECHFEKKTCMRDDLYDTGNPITWSTKCRPEPVELASFFTTIGLATAAGFKGTIHACHVSTLEVADYVRTHANDPNLPFKLSCGITPHHFIFSNKKLAGPNGYEFKCNPALRSEYTRTMLEHRVINGGIEIIESDHAPHRKCEDAGIHSSGIATGAAWPFVISYLRRKGATPERIRALTFTNPVRLYGLDLQPSTKEPDFERLKALKAFYTFDPFVDLER
ncbi:MAG TPA: hypothetical protein VJJ82_04645 [Candidatus Nanoarchaeia archaeon]|nr:hypothetical protein [Candidatus Nanoarchaeia archaeon]